MEVEDWEEEVDFPGGGRAVKPEIPHAPTDTFYCRMLRVSYLKGSICVRRQMMTIKAAGREKPDTRFTPCSTGKCHQGRLILREQWAQDLIQLTKNGKL